MRKAAPADKQTALDKVRADREKMKADIKTARQTKIAAHKASVKDRRISKLEAKKARMEAKGHTNLPAYQKVVDLLNKLLGVK